VPLIVAQRGVAHEEPSVLAVVAPGALLVLEREPALQGPGSRIPEAFDVFRMEDARTKIRSRHLARGETGVVEHHLVHE
jgi:hypothetical protein